MVPSLIYSHDRNFVFVEFGLAKAILFPPGLLPPLRLATAEKLVIDSSNDMYNNATSGNRHQGLMKMAYEWYVVRSDQILIIVGLSQFKRH